MNIVPEKITEQGTDSVDRERLRMIKIADLRKMARQMGINCGKLNKVGLIRAIQRAEGYQDCYASPYALECNRIDCLWREDCLRKVMADA